MKGVWFDEIHSYTDLNLILSKVDLPPAIPKTTFVDIPGGDGSVDLTEALGEVRYKDREATLLFTAFPDDDFEAKKREVAGLINGKRMRLRLDKDPGYYWDGRCVVKEYATNKSIRQITVGATLAPYKMAVVPTTVIIPSGQDVAATLTNGRRTVVPTVTCTAEAQIEMDGQTHTLGSGTHRVLELALTAGDHEVIVTSAGPVTITYQTGEL